MDGTQLLPEPLTHADVMADLEGAGSVAPVRAGGSGLRRPPRRRTVGGPAFLRSYVTARTLGRIHPRLARRALRRLWFTPWVHPSTRRPITDLPAELTPWTLRLDDRALHGFTGGTGPTVVLVHGWAGRAADWRHLAHDLIDAGWRVVAPDLPAHGMTAGRTTDAFALGRAAAAVLRHERPVAVVAHSMGFPITLLAFDDGAEVPATLVALAPGRRMIHALERFSSKAKLPARLHSELRVAVEDEFGDDIWDILDVDRTVPQLTARGLVVHDAADDEVPIAHGRQIADQWPNATFVSTEGLGHRRILRDAGVRGLVAAELGRWTPEPSRAGMADERTTVRQPDVRH